MSFEALSQCGTHNVTPKLAGPLLVCAHFARAVACCWSVRAFGVSFVNDGFAKVL